MVDGNKIIIIFYFIYCVCANYKCCIMPSRGSDLENKVSCIFYLVSCILYLLSCIKKTGVRRGRDRMVVGFTTTYESSTYHH